MKNLLARFALLSIAAVLAACATAESLKPTDVGQTAIFHNVSFEKVFETTSKVMSRKLTIIDSDLSMGMIRAESRAGVATWGEVVAAFISKVGPNTIQLKVVSKKRSRLQITGQDWAPDIINAVRIELGQYK